MPARLLWGLAATYFEFGSAWEVNRAGLVIAGRWALSWAGLGLVAALALVGLLVVLVVLCAGELDRRANRSDW